MQISLEYSKNYTLLRLSKQWGTCSKSYKSAAYGVFFATLSDVGSGVRA